MTAYKPRSISYPKPVRYALRALWSSAWLGLIAGIVIGTSAMSPTDDATSLIQYVLSFLLAVFLLVKFSQKRSWARIVLLIFVVPQSLLSLLGAIVFIQSVPLASALPFAQAVLCGVGAYFLFQPATKEWCASRKKTETNSL